MPDNFRFPYTPEFNRLRLGLHDLSTIPDTRQNPEPNTEEYNQLKNLILLGLQVAQAAGIQISEFQVTHEYLVELIEIIVIHFIRFVIRSD